MATNTGIEVTALRPAASAGDFYVRPEAYDPSVANGLARLSGTMNKKQNAEAKLTAENLHISDSLNNSNDLHNFDAYVQESPAVIAYLKELRGRSYANQWRTKVEGEYNEWRMNSDESGMDFAGFMAERKTELADALQGDRYMTSGAMNVINEADHNMRSSHRSFLDQRMRVDVQEQMGENISAYMSSMKQGDLGIGQVASQVDDMVQLAHDTGGLNRSKGNSDMFDNVVAKYRATGDYDYLLLAQNLKFAKGANGHVNAKAQLVLEQAKDEVEADHNRELARKGREDAAANVTEKQSAWNDFYEFTGENPNAAIPPEMVLELTSRGVSMSTINTQRDAVASAGDIKYGDRHSSVKAAILLKVASNTYNNKGLGINYNTISEMIGDGTLHPNDAPAVIAAMKTAEKATPLLHSVTVKGFKGTMMDELKNSFNYKSPANAKRVADLERSYDIAFTRLISQHYTQGSDGQQPSRPTPAELSQYAAQAETVIKQSSQFMVQQNKEHDVYISSLTTAASNSEDEMSFYSNDAEIDNVEAVFLTPDGAKLKRMLLEDPMMIQPFNGVDMPVWEILDEMSEGYGGFHVWYSANKAHFDRSR